MCDERNGSQGALDAKDAAQVNTAIRGSLSALKREFDVLRKAKVDEGNLRNFGVPASI